MSNKTIRMMILRLRKSKHMRRLIRSPRCIARTDRFDCSATLVLVAKAVNTHHLSNRLKPHPCLLSPLNEINRWHICLPPMNQIDRRRKPNDAHPQQRRPIRGARRHRHRIRKSTKYHDEPRIEERKSVDRQTPCAEAPSGWRQILSSDALE